MLPIRVLIYIQVGVSSIRHYIFLRFLYGNVASLPNNMDNIELPAVLQSTNLFWFVSLTGMAILMTIAICVAASFDDGFADDESLSAVTSTGPLSYVGTAVFSLLGFIFAWFVIAWSRIVKYNHEAHAVLAKVFAVAIFVGYMGLAIVPLSIHQGGHAVLTAWVVCVQVVYFTSQLCLCLCGYLTTTVRIHWLLRFASVFGVLFLVVMFSSGEWRGKAFRLDMMVLESVGICVSLTMQVLLVTLTHNENVEHRRQSAVGSL